MKLKLFILAAFSGLLSLTASATVHNVNVANFAFTPSTLTIMQGDTVVWTVTSGSHNVNGSIATFPTNPASFGPTTVGSSWTFSHTFTVAGSYSYQCDPHSPNMAGTITVTPVERDLLLTAVYDGPLTGGNPKGVEIYALKNIADLSTYGIGSANNGGGSDSVEFQFPAISVTQGDYIYVSTDSTHFHSFFGFSADFISGSMAINGDDAVELFNNGIVIDVFGDINVDGSGTAWDYLDSWAYRKHNTGPDSSNFVLANWTFGGINVYDNVATNAVAAPPCPIGTYSPVAPVVPTVDFALTNINALESAGSVQVNVLISPAPTTAQTVDLTFALGAGINLPADGSVFPLPSITTGILQLPVLANQDTVSFTVNITDDAIIEGNETLFVAITAVSAGMAIGTSNAMIFEVVDNDFRTADIATISSVDPTTLVPDSIGIKFITHGVVYTGDFDGNAGLSFYMQDATGGINVFNFNDVSNYTVTRGDSIRVIGEIDQYRGLTELVVDSIAVLKTGVAIDRPAIVSMLDETTEGELIQMDYVKLVDPAQWTNSGSGFNVNITNGVDTFIMRIDNDVNLFGQPAPTGLFTVIGAGSQFSTATPPGDGYQIFPRDTNDIIPINEMTIDAATTVDASLVPVELGNKVVLSGVVYTEDFDGNNGHSFYIYDNTGGVNVFNFDDVSGYTVTRGDSIRIIGEIAQFRGLTELDVDSIEVLKTGIAIKTATTVSVLDESTEGEFIHLSGWNFVDTTQWTPGAGTGFNVDITNGTDTFIMRIDNDIDLFNMPLPTSGVFDVYGAGSQFSFGSPANDGYQIFPRDSADIIINVSLKEIAGPVISVYPNPVSNAVFIERENNAPAKVTITNITGSVVRFVATDDKLIEIETSNLTSGTYIISVEVDGAKTTRKIVVR